jgi:membrane-bound lytic murein transglycosylase D
MILFRFLILFASCFLIACASQTIKPQSKGLATGSPELSNLDGGVAKPSGPDLNDNETDMQKLPAELNEKVTMWIEYFKGRGREHMTRYLSRSSRYLPKMKEILNKHGLPEDLVYIALIESGFNSKALSRSNAVGYWQFIRGTGKRYGLQQNYYVDERRDFIESTEAASFYLKALYNLFGSWYLAIASYNVGENRIKNLVMKYYTRDFWQLAAQNRLPAETENYVPKFLAARLIAKHPEKYGFDNVVYEPPLDFKEVTLVNKGVNLNTMAGHLGMASQELLDLNPSYKRGIIPKREGEVKMRVPTSLEDGIIVAALAKSSTQVTISVIASGEGETYRIRRGDTLSHIAQQFGTSIAAIREANNLSRRDILYPGKKLIVPTGRKFSSKAVETEEEVKLGNGERQYTVQEGDNLYTIAKKFGISLAKIKDRNNLGRKSLLNIGKTLIIPALNSGS